MPTDSHLELIDVSKQYDSPAGATVPAVLRDINLHVGKGESLAIVGPSGCGKSTLLNIIGTLDCPSAGLVLLDGQDLSALNDGQLAGLRRDRIGFIFQLHHLLPQCSVLENVLVPTLAAPGNANLPIDASSAGNANLPIDASSAGNANLPIGDAKNADQEIGVPRAESGLDRARRLLGRVGLADRMSYRPGQLSGGERQRAAVVRALINQPELLLADEPTGALDRASSESLGNLLCELNKEEGVTLIVVTHSMDLAARMGQVYELRDGSLARKEPGA